MHWHNSNNQWCGSSSFWCGCGSDFLPWCGKIADPNPDSTFHFDLNPNPSSLWCGSKSGSYFSLWGGSGSCSSSKWYGTNLQLLVSRPFKAPFSASTPPLWVSTTLHGYILSLGPWVFFFLLWCESRSNCLLKCGSGSGSVFSLWCGSVTRSGSATQQNNFIFTPTGTLRTELFCWRNVPLS
jgi:hypothetical protein